MCSIILACLVSCSKDGTETQKPDDPETLSMDVTPITVSNVATTKSIVITNNYDWAIYSNASWCKLSTTYGSKGQSTVELQIEENTTYDDRSAIITVQGQIECLTLNVTQRQKDALVISKTEYEVSANSGEIEVELNTNATYEITVNSNWIHKVDAGRGLTTNKVKFIIDQHTGYDDRTGIISVKGANGTTTITVIQRQKNAIIITSKNIEAIGEGEEIEIEISANITYDITQSVNWITPVATPRGLTTNKLKFTVAANNTGALRTGKITVKNTTNGLSEDVTVTQKAKVLAISCTPFADILIPAGGSTVINYTLTGVSSSATVTATVSDGWKATVSKTNATTGKITVTAPKPFVNSTISIKATEGTQTPTCTLSFVEGIATLDESSFDIPNSGATQTVKVTTNFDYTVSIPVDAQSWLSVASSRAIRTETLTFTIKPNNGNSRSATVTLVDNDNKVLQSIVFNQFSKTRIVNVETKGTLSTLIPTDEITSIESLKITGILNDVDFITIKAMTNLESIDLSEVNITTFPNNSLFNKTKLKEVLLPNTLTEIIDVLSGCKLLKSIVIPANVETIGYSAFKGCTALTTVTLESGSKLKIIKGGFFDYGSWSDSRGAFSGCTSLKSIIIPAGVEIIEEAAFKDCTALTTVTFEPGSMLKTIKGGYCSGSFPASYGAFSGCTSLNSITIPASAETIEGVAFKDCTALTTVTFEPGSILKTIGGAFAGCTSLNSITIPTSVETIGGAFSGCSTLTSVTFESGSMLKTIRGRAFSGCTLLSRVTIPASVETIEEAAFINCTSLTTFTFESGSKLKTLGGGSSSPDGIFAGCGLLKNITIPASVETIEAAAFKNCTALTTITFESGSNLKTIKGAFSDCTSLKSITIPAGVETIEARTFSGCTALTTVTFEVGSKLKTIGGGYNSQMINSSYGAFTDCTSLTTFDAKACTSLSNIEIYAFYKCSNLSLFIIGAITPPIADSSNRGGMYHASYAVLKVPQGCVNAYKTASWWGSFSSISEIDD